ncbi:rifin PIR protein, putative [Plasmodium reichenowi]|uniref:Rifin PIR protein, putative n=1 Tax=Plasmodium reichenowi TaxID=5854 RepID=A0A2P9DHF2_PLARE|nr:rifin PIR protein, putative [Plasmodium reichenowi]
MKVHYINILLFALPLNILVSSPHKKSRTTPKIPITRLLCEYDLYMPNYDSDPQMKNVMDNFNKQTQKRFHEYDNRMKEKRKQCKEQCDKESQKIILKDKIEKELTETLTTLDTNITTENIPTCICEKSMTDKVEKGCLRCGSVLGGGVAPSVGILGGIGEAAMSAWKFAALNTAAKYAMKEGLAFGKIIGEAKGMEVIIGAFEEHLSICKLKGITLKSFFRLTPYNDIKTIASVIDTEMNATCWNMANAKDAICVLRGKLNLAAVPGQGYVDQETAITNGVKYFVGKAEEAAAVVKNSTTKGVADIIKRQQTSEIAATYMGNQTIIIASIIAIVVIVLIMVIIYLILRYRRKKKMKKKLQYIKLLEE